MYSRLVIICSVIAVVTALPTARIVGGDNATFGQFPYQVSLLKNGSHFCGGSVLNERYVLTAAHCVVVRDSNVTYPVSIFQVRLGSIYHNSFGDLYDLKSIIVNQYFGNFLNDVALLETEKPIIFTENIETIELARDEVPSGEDVIITGWGRIKTGGPLPKQLKWTTVKALNSTECQERTNKWGCDSIICLSHGLENGVCNGDSGGPAVYNNTVVGIAGFVISGCGTTYPDGYTKIFYHRQWIEDNMIL